MIQGSTENGHTKQCESLGHTHGSGLSQPSWGQWEMRKITEALCPRASHRWTEGDPGPLLEHKTVEANSKLGVSREKYNSCYKRFNHNIVPIGK